jgi:hypothetical protein
MLAVDEVPLDQFYREYVHHLDGAGFKLLIMALVREADAPIAWVSEKPDEELSQFSRHARRMHGQLLHTSRLAGFSPV